MTLPLELILLSVKNVPLQDVLVPILEPTVLVVPIPLMFLILNLIIVLYVLIQSQIALNVLLLLEDVLHVNLLISLSPELIPIPVSLKNLFVITVLIAELILVTLNIVTNVIMVSS